MMIEKYYHNPKGVLYDVKSQTESVKLWLQSAILGLKSAPPLIFVKIVSRNFVDPNMKNMRFPEPQNILSKYFLDLPLCVDK